MSSVMSFAEAAKAAAAAAQVSKKGGSPQNSASPSPPGVPVLPPPPQMASMAVRMSDAVAAAQAAAKVHKRPSNHHKAPKNATPNFGPPFGSVTPPPLYSTPTVPVEPTPRRASPEIASQKSAGSSPKTPPGPQAPPAVSLRQAAKGAKQQVKANREKKHVQDQQSATIQTLMAQQQQLIAQRQMLLAAQQHQHQGIIPMMPLSPVAPLSNASPFPPTALATPPGPGILSPAMQIATPTNGSKSPQLESSGGITAEDDDDVPELITVPEEWDDDAPALIIEDECPPELLAPAEAWAHTRGSPVPPRFPTDDWEGGGAPQVATTVTLRRC